MTTQQQMLDFCARPAAMTSARRHAPLLDELPNDVGVSRVSCRPLALHEYMASAFYSVAFRTSAGVRATFVPSGRLAIDPPAALRRSTGR